MASLPQRRRNEVVLGGRPRIELTGDATGAHHQDAVRQAQKLDQLRGDQNHGAVTAQVADHRVDLRLGTDVDAARRLVEKYYARIRGQGRGKQCLLLVAAGQRADVDAPVRCCDSELPYLRRREGLHGGMVYERAATELSLARAP